MTDITLRKRYTSDGVLHWAFGARAMCSGHQGHYIECDSVLALSNEPVTCLWCTYIEVMAPRKTP